MRLLSAIGLLAACAPDDLVRTPRDPWEERADSDSVDSDAPEETDVADTDEPADPDTDPPDPQDAPAVSPPFLSTAAIAALQDTLDALLDGSTATHGALVVDLDNGQIVYERDADLWLKPASNTKLFTTAVALDTLGPDHRAEVVAWASADPVDGRIGSDLVIVGQHDGSWSTWLHDDPRTPADRLALDLYRKGVRRIAGRLVVRGDYVWEPYHFGTLDPAAQRAAASTRIRDALVARGIVLDQPIAVESSLSAPPGWKAVGTWRGSSLEALTAPINKVSHNELADNLARHVGWSLAGQSSYAASEAEIRAWLVGEGLDARGFNLDDGSGLSHNNRVSARLVVGLFQVLDGGPTWPAFRRSLSVAGVDGTFASRMTGADTSGRFHGKSGTLNGVIATSGVLFHRHDGHRYAIALLANDVGDSGATRALHDRVVAAVGGDLRRAGTRPPPPILREALADSGRVRLTWRAPDAEVVEIWSSDDGLSARRAEAIQVAGATWTGPIRGRRCYRAVSVRSGLRSPPSDILCADPGPGPRVLVVDGHDRWGTLPENTLGEGHDLLARVATALPRATVSSADNDAVAEGAVALAGYDLVIWLLGEESTENETFSKIEQGKVRDYVDAGGALVVSGAEVGWDLGFQGDAQDRAFVTQVLGGSYVRDDAETWLVEAAEATFVKVEVTSFHLPGHLEVLFPDVLSPGPGARTALAYDGGSSAAIRRTDRRVLWTGFPIEALDDHATRTAIFDATWTAFGLR